MAKKPLPEEHLEEEIEYVSKTQLKQEAKDLRDLGEQIINLSPEQREKLPLNDEIEHALIVADKIRNTREAFRRHLQFVGRLLRNTDSDAIRLAMDKLTNTNKQADKALRHLEDIRTALLEQGDSKVNELVGEYPLFERQKLRQLVKKTLKQQKLNPEQTSPAFKELFQYLKEVISE